MNGQELSQQLSAYLPQTARELLELAAQIAAEHGAKLYLVGGPVRDLLLKRPLDDLDLVVEGDAWPVADAFAATLGAAVTHHAAFRTAVVQVRLSAVAYDIDFVTARRERYPQPAALPEITPSHMLDDLHRRDFTINALALELLPSGLGTILDPYGGMPDLTAGQVRVLHNASFLDDPTRILRAARFATRLDFVVEPATRRLVQAALGAAMIARTSSQRILHELWLMLDEPRPEEVLALLHSWSALAQLELAWCDQTAGWFAAARDICRTDRLPREIGLGLLAWAMDTQQRARFAARYNLPAPARKLLQELPAAMPDVLQHKEHDALVLDQLLHGYRTATLRTLQAGASATAAANIGRYVDEIRPLPPLLSGDDLLAHGLEPGPQYRKILAEARKAQLRGEITSHEAALLWLSQRV